MHWLAPDATLLGRRLEPRFGSAGSPGRGEAPASANFSHLPLQWLCQESWYAMGGGPALTQVAWEARQISCFGVLSGPSPFKSVTASIGLDGDWRFVRTAIPIFSMLWLWFSLNDF